MDSLNEIDAILAEQRSKYNSLKQNAEESLNRTTRLRQFAEDTPAYLDSLNKEFENKTSLNKNEMAILFVTIGMQIIRQHFLTKFSTRTNDQVASKETWGHTEEHSNRHHRYYNPSLDEIITNPVPFDANIGSNGALAGGGIMGHRVTALGHDPLLGLIIGTANIATSTITTKNLVSFHIRTYNKRDTFAEHASTALVLSKTANKFFEGSEGLKKIGASFLKELIHLRSDMNTYHGLPLPVISVINAKTASDLASYGADFSNAVTVLEQVVVARMINNLIAMYHFSFYDEKIPIDLYKVKTKKIICYSNVVASSVNLAEVGITSNYDLLDIGGIANTIFEVVTSSKFMKKVKREFVLGGYDNALAEIFSS